MGDAQVCVWITNLVTGHAVAADLTPQSAIDSIESVVIAPCKLLMLKTMFWLQKNIAENICMGKTYYIRKVQGGVVRQGSEKKKRPLVSFPRSAAPLEQSPLMSTSHIRHLFLTFVSFILKRLL
jgi:hypothetical protein